MSRLLVISNGHGEDQIACHIVKAFLRKNPQTQVIGFPLVGEGLAYKKLGISSLKKPNPTFPSGGFIRNLSSLIGDLRAGLLSHIFRQKKILKKLSESADIIVCVGDIFCLWMGSSKKRKVYFLPTAKSDLFMPHSRFERRLMCLRGKEIFTRDLPTAISLQRSNLPAYFLGNPMMDGIKLTKVDFKISPDSLCLALLPGSREDAYPNLKKMLDIVKRMQISMPTLQVIIAKAPTLKDKKIQHLCAITMIGNVIVTEHFWDALKASHLVLGLSGTANEQAVYVEKTVYCFEGTGTQASRQRFLEQAKLLGENLKFLSSSEPGEVAQTLVEALKHCPQTPDFKVPEFQASDLIYESIMGNLQLPG